MMRKLRERLPETKVLLLAILPRDVYPSDRRERITQSNKLIASWVDQKDIVYYAAISYTPAGAAKPGMPADGEILVDGSTWPKDTGRR
jgi:hypothetical protein